MQIIKLKIEQRNSGAADLNAVMSQKYFPTSQYS